MSTMPVSLRRAAIGLLLVDVLAVALIAGTLRSQRQFAYHSEETFVTLAKDVTRASQAQATAERMVAIGRGYLLTVEPELLARSQAAEAKLSRTLQTIAAGGGGDDEQQLAPVLASARQYRQIFSALLSGEDIPHEPHEVLVAFLPTRRRSVTRIADGACASRSDAAGNTRGPSVPVSPQTTCPTTT